MSFRCLLGKILITCTKPIVLHSAGSQHPRAIPPQAQPEGSSLWELVSQQSHRVVHQDLSEPQALLKEGGTPYKVTQTRLSVSPTAHFFVMNGKALVLMECHASNAPGNSWNIACYKSNPTLKKKKKSLFFPYLHILFNSSDPLILIWLPAFLSSITPPCVPVCTHIQARTLHPWHCPCHVRLVVNPPVPPTFLIHEKQLLSCGNVTATLCEQKRSMQVAHTAGKEPGMRLLQRSCYAQVSACWM